MQNRMLHHPLTQSQIDALLCSVPTASLATLNADGAPYALPVHFVYDRGRIYIHGLPQGQKIDNILRDSRVSFSAYRMDGLLMPEDDVPCDVNTQYESVVISGSAALVEDDGRKREILALIIAKYTPQLIGRPLPDGMVDCTAVIEITPCAVTGKYYG